MDEKEDKKFAFCEKMGFMISQNECDECFMKGKVSCELREKIVFDRDYNVNKISDEMKNIFDLMKKQTAEIQEKIREISDDKRKEKKEGNN